MTDRESLAHLDGKALVARLAVMRARARALLPWDGMPADTEAVLDECAVRLTAKPEWTLIAEVLADVERLRGLIRAAREVTWNGAKCYCKDASLDGYAHADDCLLASREWIALHLAGAEKP